MVTTTCQEVAGVPCKTSISGNSLEELKSNAMKHAQAEHGDALKSMTPQQQGQVMKQIENIWKSKSGSN
jgi:predicted small metal-binding protein